MQHNFGQDLVEGIKSNVGKGVEAVAKGASGLKEKIDSAAEGLAKEAKIGPQLHERSLAALQRMQENDVSLKKAVEAAYGFAVFPSAARASIAALGVTYGTGEVFEKGRVVGYAGMAQLTVGTQIGGETLHMLVILDDEDALKRLKSGKISFAANASVAIVKAGSIAGKNPNGLRVFLYSEGGEMLEASIGGQTFRFRAAALGRLRDAEG